jgi:hypothetical protein
VILIKIFVVCLFAGAWWRSKISRTAEPSDFFFISFLVIYVPGFLGNPSGNSSYNGLALSPLAAHNAEIGLSLAMVAGAVLLIMRREVELRVPFLSPLPSRQLSSRRHASVSFITALISILLALALAFDASYREYKDYVLQFFSMQLSGVAYRFIRVYWFSDSFVVNSLLERARYTVFPILYVLSISYLVARGRILASVFCAALFFFLLPASLSKLPLVIYAGYLLTLCLTRYPKLLTTGWLVVMGCLASVLLIAGLSLLYHFQYAGSVAAGKVFPVDLAFQRLWGEPYSIVVRYYETYPKILPFTGWDGISLFARLAGHDARMPDIEVPNVILGPDTGSNPAVFFLAGYAAFEQAGLTVCAFAGFVGLWLIDIIGRKLRFGVMRAAYVAIMGVNTLFLNQIALHTALLTYGLGLIPLVLLAVDLALRYTEGPAAVRGGGQ